MSDLPSLLAQKAALDAQIEEARKAQRTEALGRVSALMAENGLTTTDLIRADRKPRKVEPKFRDHAGNTWTGRGKQPKWLAEAIARGQSIESFLIRP